jgi:hypothetical protein
MLWFRQLTKQLSSGGNISAHITGFQEAICYLANTKFNIPSYITATILLSTLPSNPGTNILQLSKSTKIPPLSCLLLMAFSKRNNDSLRTTRLMRKSKSQCWLLLRKLHIIVASFSVTTTCMNVTAPLSIMVLVC